MRAPQNQEIFQKNSLLKKNATFWSFSKIYHQILDFNFVIFCDFEDFESQILEFGDSGNEIKTSLKRRGVLLTFHRGFGTLKSPRNHSCRPAEWNVPIRQPGICWAIWSIRVSQNRACFVTILGDLKIIFFSFFVMFWNKKKHSLYYFFIQTDTMNHEKIKRKTRIY